MKLKIIFIILTVLTTSKTFASDGSCQLAKAGQCFQTAQTGEDIKNTCQRFPGAVYKDSKCPSTEIAGKCQVVSKGRLLEFLFYYPNWTLQPMKARCAAMKGSFSQ